MEFTMSDEQKIFKRTVREYCQKNVEPRAGEIDEGAGGSKYVVRGGSKKVVIDITSG